MKPLATSLLAVSLLSLASAARAQPGDGPVRPADVAEAPRSGVSCEVGELGGVSTEQARSWNMLLCDELAKRGKMVIAGGSKAREVYRLDLLRLEKKLVVRLTHEMPAGTWVASERAVISDADELLTALPRLVAAVSKGDSFEQTANVGNLTAQETRAPLKRNGELMVGGTLFGAALLGARKTSVMPGLGLGLTYETLSLAAVSDLRFTIGDSSSSGDRTTSASWVSLSMGGRYFLSDTDIAPFVGGGLAIGWASYRGSEDLKGSGVGLYGEVGVEALRMHRGRLAFGVRLDLPFYQARGEAGMRYNYAPEGGSTTTMTPAPDPLYAAPLSFAGTYYFH